MGVLRSLFLEDPRPLWVILAIAEILVLAAWSRGRARWKLWTLAALPLVGVLLGLLDWAVETDYEKVQRSVRTIAQAAQAGNADRLIERISDSYQSGPYRKEHLAALVRWGLPQVTVRPQPSSIFFDGSTATVEQRYRFDSTNRAEFQLNEAITWEGRFAPDPDGEWRLRQVMMISPFERRPEEFLPRSLR
jgi:hypothetical protein